MADSDAVQQFLSVTGASQQAAEFYLESSHGDLETAIDSYLESNGEMPDQEAAPSPAHPPPAVPSAQARSGNQGPPAPSGPPAGTRRNVRKPAAGNVRSLADLGDSDSDEDSDEANEYYAGGQKSGQVVKGAPKNDKGDNVEGLFDRARQAGAQPGSSADLPGAKSQRTGTTAFAGTARTLAGGSAGGEEDGAAENESATPAPSAARPREHVITFWRNNIFTVDDGEPRSITAASNREFLDAVVRGECPRELESPQGTPVQVSLLRRNEDFVPPAKPRYVAFSGSGRTLAGQGEASSSSAAVPSSEVSIVPAWEGVNESQPVTSLQLRLADGSRMIARFNLSHTIADIRRFINASRPDIKPPFRLATAFPAAELNDESASIEQAGLHNATVVQKPA